VIYLVYTEGHGGVRDDMCEEAIRLARLLARLMPDEPEVLGLLALLLVTDARRPARVADDGALVSLEEQDRSRWDTAQIAEGAGVLERALRLGRYGPYIVQAAIAALHSRASTWEATDWPQIAGLYAELARLDPSPVVTMNRAVAVGFAVGAQAGLAILDELQPDPRLDHYQPLHAARAELLRRAGDAEAADAAYATAIALADSDTQRTALERRRDRR